MSAYKQVIDLLMQPDLDHRALVIQIAKDEPTVLIAAAEALKKHLTLTSPTIQWQREVVDLIIGGNKVNAIKTIRKETNFGLKEAKDIADHLHRYLYCAGRMNTNYDNMPDQLWPEQNAVFNEIVRNFG